MAARRTRKAAAAVKKPARKTGTKVVQKTIKRKVAKKSAASSRVPGKSTVSRAGVRVGDRAPSFSLLNQQGKTVCLSDFKGKFVVLYFYPRAMTPGCTIQACGIRDHSSAFRKANAVVLGVSPDKVPALEKFSKHDKLDFDLLSDEDKSLARQYGAWGLKKFMGREFMGVRRWTFIIGKDGRIKHIMDKVDTKTHHDDVLEILESL